jgi:hypothetical protein
MAAREFLQFFGTDVCRAIYEDVWQSRLIKDIIAEEPLVAVIDDCRFPNEVQAVQEGGGKVIRLTRCNHKDSHASECALSSYKNFDAVIDNQNASISETNIEIIKTLTEWGWMGTELKPEELKKSPNETPHLIGGIHKFHEED